MLANRFSDRSVRPRHDTSDEEYSSEDGVEELLENSEGTSDGSEHDIDSGQEDDGADGKQGSESIDNRLSESSEQESERLENISFGALAKAQESFKPPSKSQKRKLAEIQSSASTNIRTTVDNPHPTRDTISKKPKQDLTGRTSKHAPAVLSSRNPVSRRREIFSPPPVQRSRDPRFDPAITSRTLNANAITQASKAYSFLNDYQATEILQLKSEIKKALVKDPEHAAELKKKLMSMESRLRNNEVKSKEREILARHKTQEKQAIREGKKNQPYFLKKSDIRKEIQKDRVEGMGKRQKDKMEKRKRMREKTKEAKDMPWARRMG